MGAIVGLAVATSGWRSWARAVAAALVALTAFRLGDRTAIPAKVASNLQPHHKHTFTSRLRDAWGRGFLWRSSAVKWETHRASHACMRKPGGSPISVRGLFEHRGNPCPFGCPSIYSHSVTLLMSGVGMQPPRYLPQLEFMMGKKKRRRAMFLRMGPRLSS